MNAQIALPYLDGQISQHFGKSSQFKIYSVKDGAVASSEVVDTEGVGHEDLALWLVWHGVNLVICGGVGPGMQGALLGAGIQFIAGIEGSADEAVAQLLAGKLAGVSAATCGGGAGGGCGGHCGGGCGGHCGGGCHG